MIRKKMHHSNEPLNVISKIISILLLVIIVNIDIRITIGFVISKIDVYYTILFIMYSGVITMDSFIKYFSKWGPIKLMVNLAVLLVVITYIYLATTGRVWTIAIVILIIFAILYVLVTQIEKKQSKLLLSIARELSAVSILLLEMIGFMYILRIFDSLFLTDYQLLRIVIIIYMIITAFITSAAITNWSITRYEFSTNLDIDEFNNILDTFIERYKLELNKEVYINLNTEDISDYQLLLDERLIVTREYVSEEQEYLTTHKIPITLDKIRFEVFKKKHDYYNEDLHVEKLSVKDYKKIMINMKWYAKLSLIAIIIYFAIGLPIMAYNFINKLHDILIIYKSNFIALVNKTEAITVEVKAIILYLSLITMVLICLITFISNFKKEKHKHQQNLSEDEGS